MVEIYPIIYVIKIKITFALLFAPISFFIRVKVKVIIIRFLLHHFVQNIRVVPNLE